MILNKTFKQLIKIKDLAYLNDLGCEVIEYYPNKQYLNGRVYVTGAYHSSENNEVKLISTFSSVKQSNIFFFNGL